MQSVFKEQWALSLSNLLFRKYKQSAWRSNENLEAFQQSIFIVTNAHVRFYCRNKTRDFKFADFSKHACCSWLRHNVCQYCVLIWQAHSTWLDINWNLVSLPVNVVFVGCSLFAGFFVSYCFSVWLLVNWKKKSVINQRLVDGNIVMNHYQKYTYSYPTLDKCVIRSIHDYMY